MHLAGGQEMLLENFEKTISLRGNPEWSFKFPQSLENLDLMTRRSSYRPFSVRNRSRARSEELLKSIK